MYRGLLIFSLACLIGASDANAQMAKQKITINPDGTITIDDPAGQAPTRTLEKKKTVPPVAPKEPAAPVERAAPRVDKPTIAKPVIEEPEAPVAEKPITPTTKPPVKKKAEAPKAPSKPKKNTKKESTREQPPVKESIGKADPEYTPPPRPRGPITPEDAKRIALDVAPPALAVDVFPANYKGIKVFQVVFKTEDGDRFVLVDRATGEIIRE
jgi:hypothetical protein